MQANPNEPRKLVSKPSVDWICSNLIYAFSVVVVVSNRVYFSLLLRAEIKKNKWDPKKYYPWLREVNTRDTNIRTSITEWDILFHPKAIEFKKKNFQIILIDSRNFFSSPILFLYRIENSFLIDLLCNGTLCIVRCVCVCLCWHEQRPLPFLSYLFVHTHTYRCWCRCRRRRRNK